MTTHCGVWFAKGRLVAVVVDDEGRAAPALFVATNDDARWGLLEHLDGVHGLDCDLVIAEDLAKADPLCRLALKRGAGVWGRASAPRRRNPGGGLTVDGGEHRGDASGRTPTGAGTRLP